MTADEQACLDALRAAEGDEGGPVERHSERVHRFAVAIAAGRVFDDELLRCACWLHDIGLFDGPGATAAYVTTGRARTRELLAHWEPARLQRCCDAVELHHTLRPVRDRGLEVELLWRADRVEVSQGLLREGLDRALIRSVRSEVPVRGFVPAVVRGLGRSLRNRPGSMWRIFAPKRGS